MKTYNRNRPQELEFIYEFVNGDLKATVTIDHRCNELSVIVKDKEGTVIDNLFKEQGTLITYTGLMEQVTNWYYGLA